MDVCILDLASLRYQRNREHTSLTVYSALREVLAVLEVDPGLDERELAFLGCDAALERARLVRVDPVRGRSRLRVALYNPYTAEVSLGAIPDTRAFTDESPLLVPEDGLVASLDGSGASSRLVVAGRELVPVEHTFTSLTRAYSAHRS